MEVKRLFDIVYKQVSVYPNKEVTLAKKKDGEWIKYSSTDYKNEVESIAYSLIELGIKPNDKIATISTNRPEWNFIDMAIMMVGAIHVPIYPTISKDDYEYILNHADIRLVFIEGQMLVNKVHDILMKIPTISGIYTFDQLEGFEHLSHLTQLAQEHKNVEEFEKRKANVSPDDVATIIYTSGTTGNPKGAMLTHDNLIKDVLSIVPIPPVDHTSRAVSFLPLSHVYERMINYFYQYAGISIYYTESIGTIVRDIQEVNPHMITAVPRIIEKIYDRIIFKGRHLKGVKKNIFFWAVRLGLRYKLEHNSWIYRLKLKIADQLIYKKWREIFGTDLRLIVSGGAALQERLSKVFWAAKIPLLEGYGLTETSPVIAVSHFKEHGIKIGTVGPPISNVEVKIADDGEILARGPIVMKGYYKDEATTKQVIDEEGWFHTGDIGQIEPKGQLKITGRKKAVFKTSFGKYISPEHIESRLRESSFVDLALVLGENQKFAAALLIPKYEHLYDWCKEQGISCEKEGKKVLDDPKVIKRFNREVSKINAKLGDTEKIKRFKVIADEWSVDSGELTASLKIRRNHVMKRYDDVIQEMFK